MSLGPVSNPFTATLYVTPGPLRDRKFIFGDGNTAKEAIASCQAEAARIGWTAPTVWQFWRRNDPIKPVVDHGL